MSQTPYEGSANLLLLSSMYHRGQVWLAGVGARTVRIDGGESPPLGGLSWGMSLSRRSTRGG